MAKVAVIGSNSFSGSHFVNTLINKTDYDIVGISRSSEYNESFLPYRPLEDTNRFKFHQLDLNQNLEEILDVINEEKIEKVINYAAQGMVGQSWDNPLHWFTTNTLGIVGLTEGLRKMSDFKKYVQISTPEIYGTCENITESCPFDPSTPYAASKAGGDMFIATLVKNFNFPATFVRSTNVYGPAQQLFRIIPRSIIYTKMGKTISLQGGGKAVKSFLHIDDNCGGTLKIMEQGKSGEVYHLSPDGGHSIESIVRIICDKTHHDFDQVTEITGERQGEDAVYILDSLKARNELNWRPTIGISEGIDGCIDWVNKNWRVIQNSPLEYVHKE